MDADKLLIEAQMHLECMNEALLEIEFAKPSKERKRVINAELSARLWAAIHITQSVRLGREDKELIDTLREARRFNNVDDAPGQEGLR